MWFYSEVMGRTDKDRDKRRQRVLANTRAGRGTEIATVWWMQMVAEQLGAGAVDNG